MKWFSHKSKGAALIYAVFILFISVIIGTGLTLLYGFEKKQEKSIDFQDRVRRNVDSGLNLLLSSDLEDYPEWTILDLFEDERDSVELKIIPWGVYEVGLCKSWYRNKKAQKSILIGGEKQVDYSLYLAEMNQALSLGGNTKLSGICYIPKKGLKRGNIENQPYVGSNLLYGTRRESDRSLPKMDLRRFEEFFFISESDEDSLVYYDNMISETIDRSFFEPTVVVESSYNMTIYESTLNGNVKILCNGDLSIGGDSKLDNVIIYCDKLFIEEGFEGSIQVFARDSVFIEDDVHLTYPSAIYAKQLGEDKSAFVQVGERCSVSGEIIAYEKQLKRDNWPLIAFGEESVFQGTIYCNGYIELKNSLVAGSVSALKSIYHGQSGIYENTFVNAQIDQTLIDESFLGGIWHSSSNKMSICDLN